MYSCFLAGKQLVFLSATALASAAAMLQGLYDALPETKAIG